MHAYLIMAHDDIYLLKQLLHSIDDYRNDIFLHIDKKSKKEFDIDELKRVIHKSRLFLTDSISVFWGDFSLLECELLLMKVAYQTGKYTYYHLLSGHDLPIKSQDQIHNYLEAHAGKEFVSFNRESLKQSNYDWYRYYRGVFSNKTIDRISVMLQRKMGLDRINRFKNVKYMKGSNWFSITNEAVEYILSKQKDIYSMFKYTRCPDEIFLQTMLYNSFFRDRFFNTDYCDLRYRVLNSDKSMGNLRVFDWPDVLETAHPRVFTIQDYDDLMKAKGLFARKFNSIIDKQIIDRIVDTISK